MMIFYISSTSTNNFYSYVGICMNRKFIMSDKDRPAKKPVPKVFKGKSVKPKTPARQQSKETTHGSKEHSRAGSSDSRSQTSGEANGNKGEGCYICKYSIWSAIQYSNGSNHAHPSTQLSLTQCRCQVSP